jgi:hypothetical protein
MHKVLYKKKREVEEKAQMTDLADGTVNAENLSIQA